MDKLPFNARPLSHRHDLPRFRAVFARYLDERKGLDINALDDIEVKGRWKSFVGKWNRGELQERWYEMGVSEELGRRGDNDNGGADGKGAAEKEGDGALLEGHAGPNSSSSSSSEEEDDDDDDYLPPLPPQPGDDNQNNTTSPNPLQPPTSSSSISKTTSRAPGPSIPTTTDLALRDDLLAASRAAELTQTRLLARAKRAEEKARLLDDDNPLLPARADPGSRERKLEKRRALNEKLRAFREKSPGMDELAEEDVMGGSGGGGGVEEYKAMVRRREERKAERERRREEMERARRAEREERVRRYREREEKVVEGLRELVRARFGGGGGEDEERR
ncbi:hypothetical protein VTJ04DRAFT_6698 [Mycothermus thermophilus]|uniref:uncharacterized protein n=1 Tax=Humicola insolens TaxID=85995 RepID=UPI003743D035